MHRLSSAFPSIYNSSVPSFPEVDWSLSDGETQSSVRVLRLGSALSPPPLCPTPMPTLTCVYPVSTLCQLLYPTPDLPWLASIQHSLLPVTLPQRMGVGGSRSTGSPEHLCLSFLSRAVPCVRFQRNNYVGEVGDKTPPCAWLWEGLGKMEALPSTGSQRSPDCWGDARKWEGIFLTGMEDELSTQDRLALSVPCGLSPLSSGRAALPLPVSGIYTPKHACLCLANACGPACVGRRLENKVV